MKNTDLVQLLRELGAIAENPRLLHAGQSRHLATRARQAAEEIEGRKTPPQIQVPPAWLVESWRQGWRPADDSLGGFGTYMARESAAWGYQQGITQTEAQAQTAGEIEGLPDAETLAEFIYTDAMLPAAHAAHAAPQSACEPPTWRGGNSLMEDCARRCAKSILARFGGGEVK